MKFHAIMKNPQGLTFLLHFHTYNWYKINSEVMKAYESVKTQHDKYGPWTIHSVDVG